MDYSNLNIIDSSNNIRLVRDPSGYIFKNVYPVIGKYIGFFYAISAQGGYLLQQQFPKINLAKTKPLIYKFDLTNTLQVEFNVLTFNRKLGKYDSLNNIYANDTIRLNAAEFVAGISEKQIISLGSFSNFYNDFISYVNHYFGYAEGFTTSLFASDSDLVRNNGEFNAKSFIQLISRMNHYQSGSFIPQISGEITITDVSQLLNYAKITNVFGNRGNGNYSSGFLDGDLILVPSGISITLDLNLDWTNYQTIVSKKGCDIREEKHTTKYNVVPPSAISNIKHVITAPLLFRLTNL